MAGWPSLEDSRTHEDEALVRALRAHSTDALTLVYDRYGPQLFDYCHALLRDENTAVNIFHDVLLAAEAHSDKLVEPSHLRGWLYALARRECRRRMRERPAERRAAPETPDEFATEEERRKHQEARKLAQAALGHLNGRQRETIDLTVRHGLSDVELAGVFGISPGEAAELAHGARDELASAIRQRVGHDRIQISRLLSVLPIAMAPAYLEQRVLASAIDPEFDQERAAIARRAEPFTPDGWPADGEPKPGPRPDTLVSNGFEGRTTGSHRMTKVPEPGPAATVTMTDEEFLRSGGRSKARRAASIPDTDEPRRLPAFVIPLVAVLCVVLLVVALFKLLPGGGSDNGKSTGRASVAPIGTTDESDPSADADPVGGTDKTKEPKKQPSASTSPKPSASTDPSSPAASAKPTPTPTPSSAKPTVKAKPGTLGIAGCDTLIEAAATACTVTLTARGGAVTWDGAAGAHLTLSKRSGKLKAGQSATVTVTVTRAPCEEEATSTIVFVPGGALTVRWECEAAAPADDAGDGA